MNMNGFCARRSGVSLPACAALLIVLAGCSRKDERVATSVPTNQARMDTQSTAVANDSVLSASDAAMLKGGVGAENKPATEADRAWDELANGFQAPAEPPEWQIKEPTKEEVAGFEKTNGLVAASMADKAKNFYTRFPNHEKAADARKQEYALLSVAVQLGNTNRLEQLRQMEEARLKDPSLSEDDRLELRMQQLQHNSLDDRETNTLANLAQMEKGARALQKEFPKRPEVASLLLSVAQGWLDVSETEKSRALAREIASGTSDEEVKGPAQELLKKIERVGKPLNLQFKALDGRAVDLQQMKGQVVLIDFWATWCGPCMAELPKVKSAYEKLHPKGFEIVGISFDREQTDLDKVLAREKMSWPQYFDASEEGKKIGEEFGITAIPTMWLVDKKGVLRELNAQQGLEEKIARLMAEK